jgi:hypothetical protein
MHKSLIALLAAGAALLPATARPAEPAPVQLIIKPLLCVLDRQTSSCLMSFDIRWRSLLAGAYCLHDSGQSAPLYCWASAITGTLTRQREVSEDFVYSLKEAGLKESGGERVSEVKISVLRVDSTDRRRERRSRHVWDVL